MRFVGEEGFDFLAQCVVNAYFAKAFAAEGHAFVGGIWEQGQRRAVFIHADAAAIVGLKPVLSHGVHHVLRGEWIEIQQSFDGDAAVGHDEDERGAGLDAIQVEHLVAASVFADGGELNAVFVGPLLTSGIAVDVGDFDVEHIVHVAAHLGVGTRDVGRNHLALAASVEEKVDEDGLASVEDFEEVVGLSMAVGDGEVNGFGEGGLLCAEACAKEQEREKDGELFHFM